MAASLVLAGVTATVRPFKSRYELNFDARLTSSLVPLTKVFGENATCLRRSALFVVVPHSRSTVPSTTFGIRVWVSTATYFTWIESSPSSPRISSTISRQISME